MTNEQWIDVLTHMSERQLSVFTHKLTCWHPAGLVARMFSSSKNLPDFYANLQITWESTNKAVFDEGLFEIIGQDVYFKAKKQAADYFNRCFETWLFDNAPQEFTFTLHLDIPEEEMSKINVLTSLKFSFEKLGRNTYQWTCWSPDTVEGPCDD